MITTRMHLIIMQRCISLQGFADIIQKKNVNEEYLNTIIPATANNIIVILDVS